MCKCNYCFLIATHNFRLKSMLLVTCFPFEIIAVR